MKKAMALLVVATLGLAALPPLSFAQDKPAAEEKKKSNRAEAREKRRAERDAKREAKREAREAKREAKRERREGRNKSSSPAAEEKK
jgi:uncharacterized protein